MSARERATIAALNFAGLTISTADGTYDNLILVIVDAMDDHAKAAIEAEREACAKILDDWAEVNTKYDREYESQILRVAATSIRDRSKGKEQTTERELRDDKNT